MTRAWIGLSVTLLSSLLGGCVAVDVPEPRARPGAGITVSGTGKVAVVPDTEAYQDHERIDDTSRWAGAALVEAHTLGSTAAMLGDWDLQSTLLRRTVQSGARMVAADDVLHLGEISEIDLAG